MRTAACFIMFVLLCSSLDSNSQNYRVEKESSFITYTMRHPLHTWSGTSKDVSGILQMDEAGGLKSVAMLSRIKAFDSENSNRDAHMMEITEALTYPYVSFKSNEIKFSTNDQLMAKGTLSFHGREKMIEVPCNFIKEGRKIVVSGNFEFLLEDFNITPPSLMLMKTESLVKVRFSASFGESK